MTPQDAKVALDLISRVNIACDDASLTLAMRIRGSLHRIANGTFVVVEPPQLDAAKPEDVK